MGFRITEILDTAIRVPFVQESLPLDVRSDRGPCDIFSIFTLATALFRIISIRRQSLIVGDSNFGEASGAPCQV
jgi:hypothetical protein